MPAHVHAAWGLGDERDEGMEDSDPASSAGRGRDGGEAGVWSTLHPLYSPHGGCRKASTHPYLTPPVTHRLDKE